MPLFEFQCTRCSRRFEALVLSGDQDSPSCPECGDQKVEKLISAGSFRPNGIPSGSGGFKPPACPRGGCRS